MKKISLVIMLLFASGVFAQAAVYYVANTGSDSNPGTAALPWATIQHAANLVSPGDTVIVEDGTYVEKLYLGRSGTSLAPVVFMAQHEWGAKIAPTDAQISSQSGIEVVVAGNYITVQDFEVIGTPTTATGIKCNGGSYCKLLHNNIHDIGVSSSTCTSGAGILSNSSNNTIEGNYIHNISPPRSAGFRCNKQHGIYINGGDYGVLRNNVIFGVWQGFAIQLDSGGYSSWSISNNTIFNVGDNTHGTGGPFYFDCYSGTCDYNYFNNNLFANTQGGYCIAEFRTAGATLGTHNLYQNNLFYNCGSNIWVNGNANYSGTVTASPLFRNYTGDATGDYHLQSSSPAIDRGTATGAPKIDYDGLTRPQGSAVDIGAYEFAATASGPNPPTGLTVTVN